MSRRDMRALWLALLVACSGQTLSLGDGKLRAGGDGGDGDGDVEEPEQDGEIERPDDAGSAAPDDGAPMPEPTPVRFAAPQPIAALLAPDAADDDPSLTSDLLVLYFNAKRAGGAGKEDIWYTTRARIEDAWGAPAPAVALNTEARETGIALSADGLTLWFSSDRPGGQGGLDVYVSRRASREQSFTEITRVESLSSTGDDLVSAVSSEQRTVHLARRDDEDDDYELFVATRPDRESAFEEPGPIGSLNTSAEESDASPAEAGRYLLFTRSADLRLAERTSAGDYQLLDALDELNSDENERDAWATDDLRYIVFSSNRSGTYLLYEARR